MGDIMSIEAVNARWRMREEGDPAPRVEFEDGVVVEIIEVNKAPDGEAYLVRGSPLNGVRRGSQTAMIVKEVPAKTMVELMAEGDAVPEVVSIERAEEQEWEAALQEAAAIAGQRLRPRPHDDPDLAEAEEFETTVAPAVAAYVRPTRALDVPASEWSHTSMKLPKPLIDAIAHEAERRVMGRNRMAAVMLELGLSHLPPLPEMPGGDV